MIVQERIERFRSFLQENGFQTVPNDMGHLLFMFEGLPMAIYLDEDDEHFASVILPLFYGLDDVAEKSQAIRVAHEVTRTCKVAKVYVSPGVDRMSASAEVFIEEEGDLIPMFIRTLNAVKHAASCFVEQMGH